MCKHYGIRKNAFLSRLRYGWSIEKALTIPVENGVHDWAGNKFSSKKEMCKHYGISLHEFNRRIQNGWDLKSALTTEQKDNHCEDHLGNKFNSIEEMCRNYNIDSSAFSGRIARGWSLKDALTVPVNKQEKIGCEDHLGNKFKNQNDMCRAYKVSTATFINRRRNGWTLKEALTGVRDTSNKVTDMFGNTFTTIDEMCNMYNINYPSFLYRVKTGTEICIALVLKKDKARLAYIGLDGKARYTISGKKNSIFTAREIIEMYRPDLLEAYDKYNPTGEYRPYRLNKEDNTDE